jgi:hypothetical protein
MSVERLSGAFLGSHQWARCHLSDVGACDTVPFPDSRTSSKVQYCLPEIGGIKHRFRFINASGTRRTLSGHSESVIPQTH